MTRKSSNHIIIFVLLFLTAVFSTDPIFAQNSTTATLTVSVTIIRSNSIEKAQAPTVSNGIKLKSVNPMQKDAGSISLSGQPNGQVLLTIPKKINLTDAKGNKVTYSSVQPLFNKIPNQKSSKRFNKPFGGQAQFGNKDGKLYVWLGGKPMNTIVHNGDYKGTYTIHVEYN